MVLALAGCVSAFPEKPVTDAEPGVLAKRFRQFFGHHRGGRYLLNIHPAGYNYGTNNIVGLTLSSARNLFEVVARSMKIIERRRSAAGAEPAAKVLL